MALIQLTVSASKYVMQSQSTFPSGVLMRIALWPIANFGSVHMDQNPSAPSTGFHLLRYPCCLTSPNVVNCCPVGGTNCLGSSQIRHRVNSALSSRSNWVPHAVHIRRFSVCDIMLPAGGSELLNSWSGSSKVSLISKVSLTAYAS